MTLAIFENEFEDIKYAFEILNIAYYQNKLKYEVFSTSQKFGDFAKIRDFDLVLVDIDLTKKSELDGFQVIEKLRTASKEVPIGVLTGQINIRQKLDERGLKEYPVVSKPIVLERLKEFIDKRPA